jgi:hypothetical protein
MPSETDTRQRFTIRDLFAIVVGFAIGTALLQRAQPGELEERIYRPWPVDISLIEFALAHAIVGLAAAALPVIAFRWLAARRFTRLSLGELLWLVPFTSWLVFISLLAIWPRGGLILLFFLFASLLAAAALSFQLIFGPSRAAWTNVLGAVSCLSSFALFLRIFLRDFG